MYTLQPSVVRIGRVNQRLSVMDLSFPSHRQQLYHRTGSPPYFPPERKRQRQTERKGEAKLWKAWEPIKRRKPSPLGSFIFRSNCGVFFKILLPHILFFFFLAHISVLHFNSLKFVKAFKCLLLKEVGGSSFSPFLPFTQQESLSRFSRVFFLALPCQTWDCFPLCLRA